MSEFDVTASRIPYSTLLEKTFSSLDDAVFVVRDADRTIISCNPAVETLFGYKHGELVGQTTEVIHVDKNHFEAFGTVGDPVLDRDGVFRTTFFARRRNGEIFPTENTVTAIHDEEGRRIAAVSVVRDRTAWLKQQHQLLDREALLRETSLKYEHLVEQLPAVTYIAEPYEGTPTVYISPQIKDLLGFTQEEWLGLNERWLEQVDAEDIDRVMAQHEYMVDQDTPQSVEYRMRHRDGHPVWVQDRMALIRDSDGTPLFYQGIVLDISERKKAEADLKLWHGRYQTLVESANEAVAVVKDHSLLFVNQRAVELLGYPDKPSLMAQPLEDILPADDWPRLELIRQDLQLEHMPEHFNLRLRARDGRMCWVQARLTRIEWDDTPAVLSLCTDITDQVEAERRLSHLAYHDPVTDLPNRILLSDLFHQAINTARRNQQRLAVIYLNLDRFQLINEAIGHEQADELLIQFAERLSQTLRDGDIVARVAGDEFAALLMPVNSLDDLAVIANKVHTHCSRLSAAEHDFFITASIGFACYPEDGDDQATLLKKASIAMAEAKKAGCGNWCHFSPAMAPKQISRSSHRSDLAKALENDEFVIHYQPKVSLDNGEILGVEALLRWEHPTKGFIPPSDFISDLEDTGLILPVGEWLTRAVCQQQRQWRLDGLPEISVSVNVSARQWASPGIAENLLTIVHETGIAPEMLDLEITESIHMATETRSSDVITRLNATGITISLDDFGTGFSSLSYLLHFPVNTLKIDRSFIHNIERDVSSYTLAKAIITMGHSLNMQVIAEGVENSRQVAILRRLGCDMAQGFHFARPIPADHLGELLQHNRRFELVEPLKTPYEVDYS